ncbi:MAG: NADH-quinone oxidoreductase subunit J [Candidatus Promineifilaceae bacterium]
MVHPLLFGLLAVIAVAAALGMLLSRNAVHSALFLVLNFVTIAVLFLTLNAPFLFVIQITIYAGAIMVLFLFVVMLLGAEQLRGSSPGSAGRWQMPLSLALGAGLLAAFAVILLGGQALGPSPSGAGAVPAGIEAGPAALGLALFESYVFPFEVASVLLLVAMIGVVVLRTQRARNG